MAAARNLSELLAPGPTRPPIQWLPGFLPEGHSGQGIRLTTHTHLVPRFRLGGAIKLYSFCQPARREWGRLYLDRVVTSDA